MPKTSLIPGDRKQTIQQLTTKLEKKAWQLQELQLEHSRLMFKHQVLVECVDTLGFILQHRRQEQEQEQQQQQQQQQQPPEQLSCIAADPGLTSAAEQLLLEQLSKLPYSLQLQPPATSTAAATTEKIGDRDEGSDHGSSNGQRPGSASSKSSNTVSPNDTLAPAGNMLYVMRQVMSQPLLPAAATLTQAEMMADYAKTVRELSLCLHQLTFSQALQQEQQNTMARLKLVTWRHLQLAASLILQHRSDITAGLLLINHETGELVSEAVTSERHEAAVRHIGLSPEQQRFIVEGYTVLSEVMQPILQECRQLQQQLGVKNEPPAVLGSQTLLQHLTCSNSQKERADKLLMLLRKVILLRMMLTSLILGAFTYTQLAQLAVCMSPCAPTPGHIVAAAAKMMIQQQETPLPPQQQQLIERLQPEGQ